MKQIKYKVLCYDNISDENGSIVQKETFAEVVSICSEEALKIAKQEAYNGEYEIYDDDGIEDSAEQPSQLDLIEAQVTYTAMMTDTLLEV